jgi:hypothetical protein
MGGAPRTYVDVRFREGVAGGPEQARAVWVDTEFERHLEAAMRTRPVIEQAKGILTAYRRATPDEAFGELVRASQHHNVRLVEIAEAVVMVAAGEPGRVDERSHGVVVHEWHGLTSGGAADR